MRPLKCSAGRIQIQQQGSHYLVQITPKRGRTVYATTSHGSLVIPPSQRIPRRLRKLAARGIRLAKHISRTS